MVTSHAASVRFGWTAQARASPSVEIDTLSGLPAVALYACDLMVEA
jgi:hypothetical protein